MKISLYFVGIFYGGEECGNNGILIGIAKRTESFIYTGEQVMKCDIA